MTIGAQRPAFCTVNLAHVDLDPRSGVQIDKLRASLYTKLNRQFCAERSEVAESITSCQPMGRKHPSLNRYQQQRRWINRSVIASVGISGRCKDGPFRSIRCPSVMDSATSLRCARNDVFLLTVLKRCLSLAKKFPASTRFDESKATAASMIPRVAANDPWS